MVSPLSSCQKESHYRRPHFCCWRCFCLDRFCHPAFLCRAAAIFLDVFASLDTPLDFLFAARFGRILFYGSSRSVSPFIFASTIRPICSIIPRLMVSTTSPLMLTASALFCVLGLPGLPLGLPLYWHPLLGPFVGVISSNRLFWQRRSSIFLKGNAPTQPLGALDHNLQVIPDFLYNPTIHIFRLS